MSDYPTRYADAVMNAFGAPRRVLVSGQGCYVVDDQGRRYLDLLGGLAVNSLGHAHPAVVETLTKQAGTLGHVSNFFATPPQVALAERLLELLAAATGRVFLTNSGAEANEAGLKLARLTGRPTIVAAEGSFHGRTMGALSLTSKAAYRDPFAPLLSGVTFVPYGDADALAAAVDEHTAAVLLEPIQGEAGVVVPPTGYLQQARRIADQHGALLWLDEIQTGVGRTGAWFAFQHDGVRPDIVTIAKGLGAGFPIGACVALGPAAPLFGPGQHGSTFGGNPLAAAVALDGAQRHRVGGAAGPGQGDRRGAGRPARRVAGRRRRARQGAAARGRAGRLPGVGDRGGRARPRRDRERLPAERRTACSAAGPRRAPRWPTAAERLPSSLADLSRDPARDEGRPAAPDRRHPGPPRRAVAGRPGGAAVQRRPRRDPGDAVPRPRRARRGPGARRGGRAGLRGARRRRRPYAAGQSGDRGRRAAAGPALRRAAGQRRGVGEPRGAADPSRSRPVPGLGARPGRALGSVLGTIAGDDTVLVISRTREAARPSPTSCSASPATATAPKTPTTRMTPMTRSRRDRSRQTVVASDRIVLAYSGGLDTSVAIGWLGKETGAEVVAVAVDVGQGGEDMETIRQRALACGAVEAVVVDAKDEFAAGLLPAGAPGQRPLHGPLSAGLGACPAR